MRRKTYGNVLKAGKLIEKKGYGKKEVLEIAVQCFDNLAAMNNGMSVEWLIEKIAPREQKKLRTVQTSERKNGMMYISVLLYDMFKEIRSIAPLGAVDLFLVRPAGACFKG